MHFYLFVCSGERSDQTAQLHPAGLQYSREFPGRTGSQLSRVGAGSGLCSKDVLGADVFYFVLADNLLSADPVDEVELYIVTQAIRRWCQANSLSAKCEEEQEVETPCPHQVLILLLLT